MRGGAKDRENERLEGQDDENDCMCEHVSG